MQMTTNFPLNACILDGILPEVKFNCVFCILDVDAAATTATNLNINSIWMQLLVFVSDCEAGCLAAPTSKINVNDASRKIAVIHTN